MPSPRPPRLRVPKSIDRRGVTSSPQLRVPCVRDWQARGLRLRYSALRAGAAPVNTLSGTPNSLAPLRHAILARSDTTTLEAITRQTGRATLWDEAERAVTEGRTSRTEVDRVLGSVLRP